MLKSVQPKKPSNVTRQKGRKLDSLQRLRPQQCSATTQSNMQRLDGLNRQYAGAHRHTAKDVRHRTARDWPARATQVSLSL